MRLTRITKYAVLSRRPRRRFAHGLIAVLVLVAMSVFSTGTSYAGSRHNPQGKVSKAQAQAIAAASTSSITPGEVSTRAQYWVSQNVPYNQGVYKEANSSPVGPYRTDCSGFISMAWGLSSSLSTQTLPSVASQIATSDLRLGDIFGGFAKGGVSASSDGNHVVFSDASGRVSQDYWSAASGWTGPAILPGITSNTPIMSGDGLKVLFSDSNGRPVHDFYSAGWQGPALIGG